MNITRHTCVHLCVCLLEDRSKEKNPGVVVSQNFGDSTTDAAALAKLQELYPGRVARMYAKGRSLVGLSQ